MSMGHQIILTFDLDEGKVQENAEKEAGRQIAKTIIDSVFSSTYYREGLMKEYVQKAIKELLEPHKEEFISEAIKNVTDSLYRTKAVKEKLAEALNDGNERT